MTLRIKVLASVIVSLWPVFIFVACSAPRSEVEVNHLRDLVREGQEKRLDSLIKALDVPDPAVRTAAIKALGELYPTSAAVIRQTVAADSDRSGPALLALGFSGDPEALAFIRTYLSDARLGAQAKEAEREIERTVYTRAMQGDTGAMEDYLDAFPDSQRVEEVRHERHIRLANAAFERVTTNPTIPDLEKFLAQYGDTENAPTAQAMMARLHVGQAKAAVEKGEFAEARVLLERVSTYDNRRLPEAKRLTAQTFLLEGKSQQASGNSAAALTSLEQAAQYPEFRLEAEKLQADILLTNTRTLMTQGETNQAILLANRAVRLDSSRRAEVGAIKQDLAQKYQASMHDSKQDVRLSSLVGLLYLGEEGNRPLEIHIGNVFAKKEYASAEEFVQALALVRQSAGLSVGDTGVAQFSDLLGRFIRSALATSTNELNQLFTSSDFSSQWNATLDPLDPRQFPLVYRIEERTTRHLGLCRIALAMKALLGQSGLDLMDGSLLTEEEVRNRLSQGQVGDNPSHSVLIRAQLCAKYSGLMGELSRLAQKYPDRFMAYAIGLSVPPTKAADWLLIADAFKRIVDKGGSSVPADEQRVGLRTRPLHLVSVDYDKKSLTIQAYDPVIDRIKQDPAVRDEVVSNTLAALLNSSRIAFGLYAGIDRYTVLLGSTETPLSGDSPVRGGRFDPETRMMISKKNISKIDFNQLRSLEGKYSNNEATFIDLQWFRWNR